MNLVVFDPSIKEKITNLDKDDLSYIKKYTQAKKNSDENAIEELVLDINKDKISNICYYKGTKDTKLIQLLIKNKEKTKKTNAKFLSAATNYAFERLGAETVSVFSKEEDSIILSEGYESLGLLNDKYIYIKDREDYKEMRAMK